ncbi:ESPR-type extended signal peptide-containing protein [Neisseria sp. GT4A_CT1]|uniref:ESPR domain-containing protein n=1 Tax=Neisseria sp. GT4A_CT1 TaxID=665946 RepID=UPI000561DDBB|nr:ESPR-type extended signal peptide-containing protein [Neisseria sp. GT4A_CT1]
MNKIFKVVWNRTIGSFVVTSELAKGRVKSSSEGAEGDVRASEEGRLKTLFRLTALSAALLGFSEGAWAVIPEGSLTGGYSLLAQDRLPQTEQVPWLSVIMLKLKSMVVWQLLPIRLIQQFLTAIMLLPSVSISVRMDRRQ